jgi:broad specificity phosphatase PhoE
MGATELWLVRHGESTANVAAAEAEREGEDVIQTKFRDADVPLSPLGERQAAALGVWLAHASTEYKPRAVWASSYRRAQQTISIAMSVAGFGLNFRVDERLRDRELGVLDLLTAQGVENRLPEEAARRRWLGKFYYRPPGGESWADVAGRVRQLLTALVIDPRHDHVVVFSHQAVIMLFRYVLEDLTEAQVLAIDSAATLANTGVTRYRREDASLHLMSFNETTHLRGTAEVTHEPDSRATGR